MKRILLALSALAVIAEVSACGNTSVPVASATKLATSSPTPSASPSPTINYQEQYLTDVAPSNHEGDVVNAYLKAHPRATNAEVASKDTPYYKGLVTLGRSLLQQHWPASAAADVHSLALAVEAEANDIDPQSIASGSFDQAQFDHDTSAGTAAAQAVRADLGLPPIS